MTRSSRRLAGMAALAAAAVLWVPAAAEEFCVAPVTPSCTQLDETYDEEISTERCREELDALLADTEVYAACLSEQAASATESARTEMAYFTCRKNGGIDCD